MEFRGGGIWQEHVEFTADPDAGDPVAGPFISGLESDTLIVCGEGLVGYAWSRLEATARIRLFLGGDNITSALSVGVGLPF